MPSLQLDLAFDLVREVEAAERHGGGRRELFVALDAALRKCLAHRLLDLALGADAERLEKFPDAGVEHVLVHDRLLCALYPGTRRRSAAFAAPDCNDNSPFAST